MYSAEDEGEAEVGRQEEAEEGDKEAEPSRKGRGALNPSFSGRGRTFLPWRESESGNCSLLSTVFKFLTIC